jgi:hypothetical protein
MGQVESPEADFDFVNEPEEFDEQQEDEIGLFNATFAKLIKHSNQRQRQRKNKVEQVSYMFRKLSSGIIDGNIFVFYCYNFCIIEQKSARKLRANG